MDTRSMLIGTMLGVCICLGAMLVLAHGTQTAYAAGATAPVLRYQIAASDQSCPVVIDREKGTVYFIKSLRGQVTWERLIDGPPSAPRPVARK